MAAFPPLLAAAAAFFLLASDCEKGKNTGWERETNSEKREKKSNKEVRGERKMNKKIINSYAILICTVSKMQRYYSMLQKFDTFNTYDKTLFFVFDVPNAKYYSI